MRAISRRCDLAGVRIGAHDEIFQASHPVLVGVDTASTYCYLLSLEDHRDAVTWGVRLLELVDQGFHPDATIADAGTGVRAGQVLALPAVPCRATCSTSSVIWRRSGASWRTVPMEPWSTPNTVAASARRLARHDGRGRAKSLPSAARLLHLAHAAEAAAVALADDVTLLLGWLRHDILAVAGPCHADRLRCTTLWWPN